MKHYRIFLIFTILFCSLNSIGQNNKELTANTKFVNDRSDSFLISTRPVTNREYIIYLLWLCNTEGVDFGNVFLDAIPGLSQKDLTDHISEFYDSRGSLRFETIFQYAPLFLKNYMFNPKYIDYPVVGISWLQAGRYCKWLSDRFNEYKLIVDGYFKPDSSQQNENSFITESYLADQYFGARTQEKEDVIVKWSDRLLIPSFRLPTAKEIVIAAKQKVSDTVFRAYKFESNNFLSQWNKMYIVSSYTKLILKYFLYEKPFEIKLPTENWDINKQSYKELTLDINHVNENLSITEIFEKHNQKHINMKELVDLEKDTLGFMPYMIINENNKKEPIAIGQFNRTDLTVTDTSKLYYFRYSCTMKPKQYKR